MSVSDHVCILCLCAVFYDCVCDFKEMYGIVCVSVCVSVCV